MMLRNSSEARETLDQAFERLKDLYLTTSVLSVVRTYVSKSIVDMELWTFFCATVDFQVPVIDRLIPMLRALLREIEGRGLKFIELVYNLREAYEILSTFKWGIGKRGFSHRFIRIEDVLSLFKALQELIEEHSSLGEIARGLYEDSVARGDNEPVANVIKGIASEIRNRLPELIGRTKAIIPDPSGNSAMKRMCLFIRWMVRPYPDLNLWNFINPKHLLVSLDSGIIRTIRRAFNIKLARQANWKDVIKTTKLLREINQDDPTKYDYVLSRPSIMGYCTPDPAMNRCYLCPLSNICRSATPPPTIKSKPLTSEKERKIFERFLKIYGNQFDKIATEYPLGSRSADAVAHMKNCKWCVIEVEEKLNYTAIGQALMYRNLYKEIKKKKPEALIVCQKADLELKNACEIDAGIKVVLVP